MNTAGLNKRVVEIGKILRSYREKTGKKQSEIAFLAHISTSMLSQIERGAVSPSIDTLADVCSGLGLDIVEVFRRMSKKPAVHVVSSSNRLKSEDGGIRYERLVVNSDLAHAAEMFLLEMAPGSDAGLSQRGHDGVEMGFVLQGQACLTVDGHEYHIVEGDSVSFNSRFPHKVANDGTGPFLAVWTALPPHHDYFENANT